jgi:tetrapyrrole methylase family protein/MazG family protein
LPPEPNNTDEPVDTVKDRFRRLVAIMARLRGPDGCPWDREQTHQSLTPYLIEEAYEVKETLDVGDFDSLCEELGDLLLQVVFHAQLATEADRFDVDDVLDAICEKLIRRHPHVFGDTEVTGSGEVLKNWEDIKKAEKTEKAARKRDGDETQEDAGSKADEPPSILSGVPRSLPALLKAHRIQQKVATVGFDWATADPIWDKIHEEIDELREAIDGAARDHIAEEIGDLLFSVVNLSRRLDVPAEEALDATNRKFMSRFRRIEQILHARGQSPSDLTLDELDEIWEVAKSEGR